MLTFEERLTRRAQIEKLADILERMENDMIAGICTFGPEGRALIRQITQTEDKPQQIIAMRAFLEHIEGAYMEELRVVAPNDFSSFCEYLVPEEPPAKHQHFLCDHLQQMEERKIMRLIISMPPGFAKSTYSSHRFPAWYMGRNPRNKYIQAGHSQDFVENEFGKRVRGIIDSERYRHVFPHIQLSTDMKAAGLWSLKGGQGRYLTRGIGQGISGFRGNIAGVDDPYASEADSQSEGVRKKVLNWFKNDLMTRLLPKSPLFIVATRWHPDDLCASMIQDTKEGKGLPWLNINLPAIVEDETFLPDPLGRSIGESLWPNFFDLPHLLGIKSVLSAKNWNALYCGRPTSLEGDIMKAEWFHRYDFLPTNEANAEKTSIKRKRTTLSVDTASKITERNDYTVCSVWIEGADNRHYLAEIVRKRVEYQAMESLIEDLARKWEVDVILVEDKGSGIQYIQNRTGKAPAPIIPIKLTSDTKQFRFDGVTPMFEAGMVLIPHAALWLPDYERELLDFPNGTFDDQVDSTSQYLNWVKARSARGTKKMTGLGYGSSATERMRELLAEQTDASSGMSRSGRIG